MLGMVAGAAGLMWFKNSVCRVGEPSHVKLGSQVTTGGLWHVE